MKRFVFFRDPTWPIGTLAALAGTAFVRWGVEHFPLTAQTGAKLAGQLLALGGLALIAWGASRRAKQP